MNKFIIISLTITSLILMSENVSASLLPVEGNELLLHETIMDKYWLTDSIVT